MVLKDLKKDYPDLRGFIIHVFKYNPDLLIKKLQDKNFNVITINGEKISDETSFFEEFSKALKFPSYFGMNWDAWDECLWDFGNEITFENNAIIWTDADHLLFTDPQTFLNGVADLRELASKLRGLRGEKPKVNQFEIFLSGKWNLSESSNL